MKYELLFFQNFLSISKLPPAFVTIFNRLVSSFVITSIISLTQITGNNQLAIVFNFVIAFVLTSAIPMVIKINTQQKHPKDLKGYSLLIEGIKIIFIYLVANIIINIFSNRYGSSQWDFATICTFNYLMLQAIIGLGGLSVENDWFVLKLATNLMFVLFLFSTLALAIASQVFLF